MVADESPGACEERQIRVNWARTVATSQLGAHRPGSGTQRARIGEPAALSETPGHRRLWSETVSGWLPKVVMLGS